jgi:RNA polymerase sigma factor (sigma-70 family)
LKILDARADAGPLQDVRQDESMNKVLDYIHRTLAPLDGGLTDGQLLARFVASRDEPSFALLVRRHGPMVWRLCLRMLGHVQDAEDAFQAAFLVLACKAASVVKRESVGSFLYGVAYRTALEAKAINARRRARERQVEAMPHPEARPGDMTDWRPWLDRELSRLPEKYRIAVILCDLEGRTRKEAARQLKVPEGTLSSRLAMARRLLAKRLSRYGLSLAGGMLAENVVSASVAASLVSSTVKAAVGQAALSRSVDVLVKGALQTMLMAKLKMAVGAVMVMMALGASSLVYRASGQSGPAGKGGGGRPAIELDVLRQEVELLKLKLELVQEKLHSQELELRALRGSAGAIGKSEADIKREVETLKSNLSMWEERAAWSKRMSQPGRQYVTTAQAETDEASRRAARHALEGAQAQLVVREGLQEAEAALKDLREARDAQAERKATDALEKALKKLREQQKKQEGHGK